MISPVSHLQQVCIEWAAIRAASSGDRPVSVTGNDLTIADVVAVALYGTRAKLTADAKVRDRMAHSVNYLDDQLAAGKIVYGVNTGFGGSADTRTDNHLNLQSALVQHQNVGLLLPADKGQAGSSSSSSSSSSEAAGTASHLDMLLRSHALPAGIVRGMMLVRSNSLARGHSAVRIEVVDALLRLVAANMTPVVPLRGSISASGDLSPLSYVAGILEGNPDIHVRIQSSSSSSSSSDPPRYLPADQALRVANIAPIRFQAKEGLGITNGTAACASAASLAIHTANQLAVWAQLLTAMGTEALAGTANNYDPFISHARPHLGQAEAAATIRRFLDGSVLSPGRAPARVGLAQDRYALRTAPQWIGPQLEDLALATRQIAIELNSTTDNPLIDVDGGVVHHGGNFQAMAVTSAMEKTLLALQNLGRLLYAQSAELLDNARNRGLPPNLSADDPSTSFLCKGFDINMAAYQAELAYLAKPVSSHVQVAEMANQAVNSMALVAARYALEAAEVLSIMAATYIYVLCQALDLRCIQRHFRVIARERLLRLFVDPASVFGGDSSELLDTVAETYIPLLLNRWDELAHLDLLRRGTAAAADCTGALLAAFPAASAPAVPDGATLLAFQAEAAACLSTAYHEARTLFVDAPARVSELLSPATRIVYEFVRLDLNIPINLGVEDHPTLVAEKARLGNGDGTNGTSSATGHGTRILGTMASEIYIALRDGRMFDRIVRFCEETKPWEADTGIAAKGI